MKVPTLLLGLVLGALGTWLVSGKPHPPENGRAQIVDGKYLVYATDYGVQLFQRDGDQWRSQVEHDSALAKKAVWEVFAGVGPKTMAIAGSDLILIPEFETKNNTWSTTYKFYRFAGTKLVRVPVTDEDK
ncbi:MAG TPA: hypothetical protein VFF73_17310 [Planctomycetota bacterium]|nr:hypothetical protein [Planctomycetota bacterium]